MPAAEHAGAARALAELRVVDLSEGTAGAYCTRLLAGLGARVTRVERPGTGDRSLRGAGPFPGDVPHLETSGAHLHLNAGKRGVTLDAGSRTGAALLGRLLGASDVLVAGPDATPHLRLDEIATRFPDLVIATLTPFGTSGPRAGWRATEIVAMALGGYMSLNGDPDQEPLKVYGDQSAFQAGAHAAFGVMAALRARDHTAGSGQHVDVAAAEASLFLTAGALQRHALMGRPQVRAGARPAGFAPNRLYPSTVRPCADGYVHVHCHNRFHDLVSVLMQEPRLAAPEILAEPLGHADEIDAYMDGWLATRTRAAATAEAQELRVPMAAVLDPGEVVEDRLGQLTARRFFVDVEHPVAGRLCQPGAPVRMSATPWRTTRAPLLGEHNAEVFCGELGLSARELAALAAAGVV